MRLIHAAYEPAGPGPHPTLIALHGWGANALDLLALAPLLARGELLVLCPQGPVEVPIGPGAQGCGWFPLTMGRPPDPAAFSAGLDALEQFIEAALQRYPIAPQRLALLGFSQGGVMAYASALRGARPLAALAALSTWLIAELAAAAPVTPDLRRLPVLVQHGLRDELIAVSRGRESTERLRSWNADVAYREYDMGHEISPVSLRDLDAFLRQRLLAAA